MAGIPTVGPTGASLGGGMGYTQILTEMGAKAAQGAKTLEAGQKINASRGSGAIASQTQALANQTGGNIMGFTYE